MNIKQQQEFTAMKEKLEELESVFPHFERRLHRMERLWNRFRKREGIPVHIAKPLPALRRLPALVKEGIGRDPEEVSADDN
jgi:hypothetical protein